MKMKRKISMLLMVCVIVAGLLAGCGSRGTGNQKIQRMPRLHRAAKDGLWKAK